MKNKKRIYIDDKLVRNDINFGKKTSIKSLFDLENVNNDIVDNCIINEFEKTDNLKNDNIYTNNDSYTNKIDINNKIVNEDFKDNANLFVKNDSKEIKNSIIDEFYHLEKETPKKETPIVYVNINNENTTKPNIENESFNYDNSLVESFDEDYNVDLAKEESLENDVVVEKKNSKSKKSKVLPWMLAATSFLLAGTTTATIVLSVLPGDSLSQSQSNTVDKNINFELKHDRSSLIFDTNKKLENEFKNFNIDMDKYFFGMNLENKNNFKLDSQEKTSLLNNINNIFNIDKTNFLYNVVDTIVLNAKNNLASNYFGINSVSNKGSFKENVLVNEYKTSDIFTINGIFEMEFSFNIISQEKLVNKSNINKFSIKFKEADNINEKSYVEITNKTNDENKTIEIKEIVDIYSEYLLLNEYTNRNGIKSYLSVNPFINNNDSILENIGELPIALKKYNDYANVNYFYQFMQNKSLSLKDNSVKNIFESNKSIIDKKIVSNINDLSSIIFKDSNEIKNIFMFLGIEDLLRSNRDISWLKVNDIKLSNFVSLNSGSSNKISGSLFTNITYKTNSNIEINYYSYIFIEPQTIKDNLTLKYNVTRSSDNKKFSAFNQKEWNIQWTPIEILLQSEFIKNNSNHTIIDLMENINKIAIDANDPSFDSAWRFLKDNNFIQYVVQNNDNKDLYEFIDTGIQYKLSIKNWLFDVPYQFDNPSWENRIKTYWMYYFLDEINTIDEKYGQNVKPFSNKNPFIKNVNIDSVKWSGLLFDKTNEKSLNYEFRITYSYNDENNKKIIVDKVVTASNDNFNNSNIIKHYLPTVTIKEIITKDNNKFNESIRFNEKIDISKNIESFLIKTTKRMM